MWCADLNAERRAEEEEGHVRYLRPGRSEEVVLDRALTEQSQIAREEVSRQPSRMRPAYQAPETVETQAELELDIQVGGDGAPNKTIADCR